MMGGGGIPVEVLIGDGGGGIHDEVVIGDGGGGVSLLRLSLVMGGGGVSMLRFSLVPLYPISALNIVFCLINETTIDLIKVKLLIWSWVLTGSERVGLIFFHYLSIP